MYMGKQALELYWKLFSLTQYLLSSLVQNMVCVMWPCGWSLVLRNYKLFCRSVLPWGVLPVRGTLCLPALLLPFSLVPTTSSVWQPSQKATSICVAPTVVCPLVSKLLSVCHAHYTSSHRTYPPTPSQNSPLFPSRWRHAIHFTTRIFFDRIHSIPSGDKCIKEWSVCERAVVAILSFLLILFSLQFTSFGLTASTQFSPFLLPCLPWKLSAGNQVSLC